MPGSVGTAIGGSIFDAFGNMFNATMTADQNKKSQAFSEKMYDKQKADAYAFWSTQNDYNSPQAQMMRFQEAGLNPNLIYGQGNSGNAGPISTPDVTPAQFRAPQVTTGGGLALVNAIADLEIKQAQTDNLKLQANVITEEAALKAAQRVAVSTGEESTRFKLDFEKDLRDVSADARREQLRQVRVQTDLSVNKDAREAAMNASSVQEAAERMLTLRAQRHKIPYDIRYTAAETARVRQQIDLMIKDGVLKDFDVALAKDGIPPGSPWWVKAVSMFLSSKLDAEIPGGKIGPLPAKNWRSLLQYGLSGY